MAVGSKFLVPFAGKLDEVPGLVLHSSFVGDLLRLGLSNRLFFLAVPASSFPADLEWELGFFFSPPNGPSAPFSPSFVRGGHLRRIARVFLLPSLFTLTFILELKRCLAVRDALDVDNCHLPSKIVLPRPCSSPPWNSAPLPLAFFCQPSELQVYLLAPLLTPSAPQVPSSVLFFSPAGPSFLSLHEGPSACRGFRPFLLRGSPKLLI